ncbi:hypothetical protein ACHQM5_027333 [Ranunculus cassubicifolius]
MSTTANTFHKKEQLLESAFNGDLHRLKELAAELDDGNGIAKTIANIKDSIGLSAIHMAALQGNLNIFKFLIGDLNLNPDVQETHRGKTPLHLAITQGYLRSAVYLVKMGANPDIVDDTGASSLHYAAALGNKKLLHSLVSRGANVDALSIDGTPLESAARHGNQEAVELLLNYRANPNLTCRHVWTPLLASIRANSLQCVQLLLEAGADPNVRGLGMTPLELAAIDGVTDMVQLLLKAGADPNMINEQKLTPIEVAAVCGNNEVVEILLPKTKPISIYSKWSLGGIMKHVHSKEARVQRQRIQEVNFREAKSKGDTAFREMNYRLAAFHYSKAIFVEPFNATLFSNRSLCWLRLKQGKSALKDATRCMILKPNWPKAFYRAGAAMRLLGDFENAADAFFDGLKLDPGNQELRKAFQEAAEADLKSAGLIALR